MKRTININIGNSIIYIEEDAYETLKTYLSEIKQHFANTADNFEIVTDIENRIAEMFSEILHAQQKPAIDLNDVQTVIGQMGRVQDFENMDEAEADDFHVHAEHLRAEKKVYRDPDQAIIAGVCAGLSHYLSVDVSFVRIAAIITIFFGGAGIFAYLILWIVLPKANSRAEKMAMRGEAANLQGFKRNFEEEMANLQSHPFVKRSGSFISEFIDLLGRFFRGAGRTIIKITALIIMIMGIGMFLCLIGVLAAFMGFWDGASYQYFPLTIVNQTFLTEMIVAFFVVLAVPLVGLILFSIRVAFHNITINKAVSYSLLIIWLAGATMSIFYIAKVSSEFKERAEFTQVSELKPYKTYTLTVDRSRFFTKEDSARYHIDQNNYRDKVILNDLDGPFDEPRSISLSIEKSLNDKITLSQNYSSSGKTFENALKHAQNIHYDFLQQDSLLTFSPLLQLTRPTNWRAQEVDLLLKVPVGTHLLISHQVNNYLKAYNIWDCGDHDRHDNSEWVMTEEGLKCKEDAI